MGSAQDYDEPGFSEITITNPTPAMSTIEKDGLEKTLRTALDICPNESKCAVCDGRVGRVIALIKSEQQALIDSLITQLPRANEYLDNKPRNPLDWAAGHSTALKRVYVILSAAKDNLNGGK